MDGVYKCHGCFGEPLFCTSCCRTQHQRLPFHRVSQWTGSFFEESCLVKSGMVIWLSHGGNACPWEDDVGESALFTTGEGGSDDTDAEGTFEGPNAEPCTKDAYDLLTGVPFIKNNKAMMTIVDKSRVHTHIVKYCTCPEAAATNIQLFNMGLFPASFIEPKTAFTFNVLNDFLLDNLECGTSAMNYYSKLRRITMSVVETTILRGTRMLLTGRRVQRRSRGVRKAREHARVLARSAGKRARVRAWWTVDGCFWMAGAIGRTSAGTRARVYIVKRGNGARMCKAPYQTMRRMSLYSVFPHLVLDRYRELMRVARQWQKLKLLKWNGFGHEEKELGINVTLPARGTAEDIDTHNGSDRQTLSWLYTRSLVMDRNFKAEHLHATNPADKVSLMDGHGFMVSNAMYKEHLAIAKDAVQQSECNNHCAVNLANASRHRLEATSIGRCACVRHGCFVPHAMVDFQKGERQMNMDYVLCEALKLNAEGIRHYHKHLQEQIADSPLLKMHGELEITTGIGLWHVHGHQDSCYVRYASNFIQGTARIDGEIMETLWAPLNIISPAARGMGTPHQKECLDYQMNDCNFMKMIRMTKLLCQKYKEATKGVAESNIAFEQLDDMADADKVKDWEAQERLVHEWWQHDPTVMDIYEVQLCKARAIILGEELCDDEIQIMQPDLLILEDDTEDEITIELRAFELEKVVIPLPSNLGLEKCVAFSMSDITNQELTLRQGQANDALHHIRVHLADKAVIFQKTIRVAKSQALSTRAWAQVHSVDMVISINASIYSKCRSQLCKLGADNALMKRY
ncbi:hypothetical protein BDR06DRAFT_1030067 [Suillus hirtellus]|nr:hypothetical protein BDR06DRAFT_1030067 [Suillus hirtellus]